MPSAAMASTQSPAAPTSSDNSCTRTTIDVKYDVAAFGILHHAHHHACSTYSPLSPTPHSCSRARSPRASFWSVSSGMQERCYNVLAAPPCEDMAQRTSVSIADLLCMTILQSQWELSRAAGVVRAARIWYRVHGLAWPAMVEGRESHFRLHAHASHLAPYAVFARSIQRPPRHS
jgi:hypothetical protein